MNFLSYAVIGKISHTCYWELRQNGALMAYVMHLTVKYVVNPKIASSRNVYMFHLLFETDKTEKYLIKFYCLFYVFSCSCFNPHFSLTLSSNFMNNTLSNSMPNAKIVIIDAII